MAVAWQIMPKESVHSDNFLCLFTKEINFFSLLKMFCIHMSAWGRFSKHPVTAFLSVTWSLGLLGMSWRITWSATESYQQFPSDSVGERLARGRLCSLMWFSRRSLVVFTSLLFSCRSTILSMFSSSVYSKVTFFWNFTVFWKIGNTEIRRSSQMRHLRRQKWENN